MRQSLAAGWSAAILLALAVVGCGNASASRRPIGALSFKVPSIPGKKIPTRYTCDGADISPAMEWGPVPSGVKELAVILIAFTPNTTSNSVAISTTWSMAGINPALHHLAAGEIPPGAHVGIDNNGKTRYSICPPRGTELSYQFTLYAVPLAVEVPARFVDTKLFNLIATENPQFGAIAAGGVLASYRRRK